MLRLAVIGVGAISQAAHLPAARRLSAEIELTALYDLSPMRTAQLARAYGVRGAAGIDDLLEADDVDAVLIATPGSHADLARAALDAGKHVLAEKPLALTTEDVRMLEDVAVRRRRVLQVGYMKMYDPVVAAAARHRDAIGELALARVTVLHPAGARQVAHVRVRHHDDADAGVVELAVASEIEATRRAIGEVPARVGELYRGLLNGSLIHELSVLRALGFELPTTFTHAEMWPWPSSDETPSLLAVAPLGSEARLVLSWNWLPRHPEYAEEIALFGRDGRLRIDMAAPYLLEERSTLRLERPGSDLREELVVRADRDSSFVWQLAQFVRAVRGDEPVLADAAGVADDLRCLQGLVAALGERLGFTVGGEAADRERPGAGVTPREFGT